jgi:hypothetical protein
VRAVDTMTASVIGVSNSICFILVGSNSASVAPRP